LLCTDICDPFLLSVEGYCYIISFTDVYSRFSTSYMLQIKSDSEAALRAFISYLRAMGFFYRTFGWIEEVNLTAPITARPSPVEVLPEMTTLSVSS